MDASEVRALCSRRESQVLDFKSQDYDWASGGRYELTKDLTAMANILGAGSVAYILIGVDEAPDRTGVILGIPAESHQDDADLHSRVAPLLNRVPHFSYSVVDVDGHLVGVYTILSGGRPFFAIRSKGSGDARLVAGAPLYRNGTSTDFATPDQVAEWVRSDDTLQRRVAELQEEALLLELVPQAIVRLSSPSRKHGPDGWCRVLVTIENVGRTACEVVQCTLHVSATTQRSVKQPLPAKRTVMPPGGHVITEATLNAEQFLSLLGAPDDVMEIWRILLAQCEVTVRARSGRAAEYQSALTALQ